MKRVLLSLFISLLFFQSAEAAHIKGGFFSYKYLGPGIANPSNVRYQVTLTVYMICSATSAQISNPINFSIFDGVTNQFLQDVSVSITNQYTLSKLNDEPCIDDDVPGCYYLVVVYDLPSIELPKTPSGYIFSYQRCCRIAGIQNLTNSGSVGNTFTIKIPRTNLFAGSETNSSPVFPVNDTALVCGGSTFSYSFQANDPDGDQLTYQFCDAFDGASMANPAPTSATSPPYNTVPYTFPFSGSNPMGPQVSISSVTGLISGTAPQLTGEYVVCVCVSEFRNGILIGITRKELHVVVRNCSPLKAVLNPKPTTCDGFTVSFQNDAPGGNPAGTQFKWTFGDPASGLNDTSLLSTPTHTYTIAGTYHARLRVSLAGGLCIDSADLTVNVFPGFFPGFRSTGSCINTPFQFTDMTTTNYGVVDTWSWNFGDETTLADTSHVQNPPWLYHSSGIKTVTLTVTNSKGCGNTISFPVTVLDKPIIALAFNDTLICRNDAVQLDASGTGNFNWSPTTGMVGSTTPTPTVSPIVTTWYYVTLNDNGCINNDSVRVRVVGAVSLQAANDTTICRGDQAQLNAVTDGLSFSWTPTTGLSNPNIRNPIATVNATTTYTITANVGTCRAIDQMTVTAIPYPVANAGPDLIACFNGSVQLNGQHDGSTFTWTPASYLNNPTILNPIATPPRTTTYILSSLDTKGCPKPGKDTVVVTVLPRVRAYAGRDTSVVIGQPLQFNGTGGITYLWTPSIRLSDPNIFNPVGHYTASDDTIRYKLTVADAAGCVDSAFITVRIFLVKPTIFVPTAFTPNNDGRNDVVRPICVGIQKLNYFSVYNRWGQLVFKTEIDQDGWDGRINGRLQNSGVFVWMCSAVDYQGNTIFLKGTCALIR